MDFYPLYSNLVLVIPSSSYQELTSIDDEVRHLDAFDDLVYCFFCQCVCLTIYLDIKERTDLGTQSMEAAYWGRDGLGHLGSKDWGMILLSYCEIRPTILTTGNLLL